MAPSYLEVGASGKPGAVQAQVYATSQTDSRLQMLADDLVDEIVDAKTRLVGNLDEAAFHQRLWKARHNVVPPRHIDSVILERHEVFCSDRDMGCSHRGDRAFGHLNRHGDAILLRHVADLLRSGVARS